MSDGLNANIQDDRVDIPGACAFIGGNRPINPATLWRLVKRGKIRPPDKIGRLRRFRKSRLAEDLDRMSQAGEVS